MSSKSLMENNLTSSSSPTGCNHPKKKKMFPSNHGKNMSNPHAYFAEQCLLGDQITFSRSEPTSSFFHFSPFHDHNNRFLNYDHELRSGQQPQSPNPSTAADVGTTSNAVASKKALTEDMALLGTTQKIFSGKNTSVGGASTSRRRSSNRERHSKIFTAQGLRDRRMRLSVDVAHKFFGLQDMLGFDKASKTISWLLTKSKAAIKDLGRGLSQTEGYGSDNAKGANSTSESEDISGLDETTVTVDQQEKGLKKKSLEAAPKSKKIRGSQKDTICAAAKESRAIARAKARERTREKMSERLEKSKQLPKGSPIAQYQLTPLSPLGSAESASLINHDKKPFELGAEINEPNKLGLSIDEYHQHLMNNGLMTFFPENWDMDTTRTRPSGCDMPNTHLFTGF